MQKFVEFHCVWVQLIIIILSFVPLQHAYDAPSPSPNHNHNPNPKPYPPSPPRNSAPAISPIHSPASPSPSRSNAPMSPIHSPTPHHAPSHSPANSPVSSPGTSPTLSPASSPTLSPANSPTLSPENYPVSSPVAEIPAPIADSPEEEGIPSSSSTPVESPAIFPSTGSPAMSSPAVSAPETAGPVDEDNKSGSNLRSEACVVFAGVVVVLACLAI